MNVHKKSLVVLIVIALLCPTAVLAKAVQGIGAKYNA